MFSEDRGGKFFPSFPNLCYHRPLGHMQTKMLCVGRSDIGRACPYSSKTTHGLKNDCASVLEVVFPLGARGRGETLVFSYGIFLSTQEVNEWRCHRHESRSD